MIGFNDIIGHEGVVRHLQNAIRSDKVSHAYLFTGEPGSGKKTLSRTFAAALQCEKGQAEPCMVCDSCKKAIGDSHPDIIYVKHEKPGTISVDDVREQVIYDAAIRPYYSRYKIYIIPDAELLSVQAQNALLKTIEEPPEYVVVMLLTKNADMLLPTILSRCVRLDLKVVDDSAIKQYLMERLHVPDYQADYQAEIDVSFAHGSIGRAQEAAVSQEFADVTENALRLLKNSGQMEVYELTEEIRNLTSYKEKMEDYLDVFQFWFRDVLLFKAARDADGLVFKQEINDIRQQARERSYENLENILEEIEKTKVRLRANVNQELALELLFLTIRER